MIWIVAQELEKEAKDAVQEFANRITQDPDDNELLKLKWRIRKCIKAWDNFMWEAFNVRISPEAFIADMPPEVAGLVRLAILGEDDAKW
ncbi:MAG: hypothetical protein GXO39_01525, partial [Thermotogae bacterium]|nr:hypothetical protein [Thermotogota bacterium]